MALTEIKTSGIADDAITTDKLANAINTERTANTAKPTLANDANNRVVTGDGSGGLNGEANLTFDGSKLVVGNSGTAYGSASTQSFVAHTANAGSSGLNSIDTTAVAAGVGGEVSFAGKYNTGAQDYAYTGHIRGIKENATAGDTACALTFHTRPTATAPQERLRIKSDGGVEIKDGDLIIETAGHGINFHPHSGTDNLLDDYEKGSHTATITIGAGTITTTHSNTLTYTKIGRVVHVVGRLYLTYSQSNVTTWQTSLPFACSGGGNAVESGSVVGVFRADAVSGEAPDGMRRIRVESGNSYANMVFNTTSNGGNFGNTNPHIIFNLTYLAA